MIDVVVLILEFFCHESLSNANCALLINLVHDYLSEYLLIFGKGKGGSYLRRLSKLISFMVILVLWSLFRGTREYLSTVN